MSKGHVSIEGLAELSAKLDIVAMKARAAAAEAVREEVNAVESDAKELVPVDTGAAQAGIVGEAGALDGTVSATARHSKFIEQGTYKDPSQPFMAPAAERSRIRWPARAGALIRTAVEGIGR